MANIIQKIQIPSSPKVVYEVLLNSTHHTNFTGSNAKIDPKEGGKFNAYDSYATGEFTNLKKDKTIELTWRASDWEEGVFSKIKIALSKRKDSYTLLTFKQTGVPENTLKDIEQGWYDYYWEPLTKYIIENNLV